MSNPVVARPRLVLRRLARKLHLRTLVEQADERLPHGRRSTCYAGFELVYSRRNSLIERIERWGAYEPEIIAAICTKVAGSSSKTLVDVGANIGLVGLAVLEAVPDAHVYAFEPGPHQHELLARTIRRNGLESRLELSALALSDSAGTATFAVHSTRHAAGDGLLDTHRSGRARNITVRTDTLDSWWEGAGRPAVAVIKLDTEGSELLILRGSTKIVASCRPTLFLEIHERNLEPYPYGPQDVRDFVAELGYVLEPISSAEFVASPQ